MTIFSKISKEELQELSVQTFEGKPVNLPEESLSLLDDPERKKVELKSDPITNTQVKEALHIVTDENERDTVSEDDIIASESKNEK